MPEAFNRRQVVSFFGPSDHTLDLVLIFAYFEPSNLGFLVFVVWFCFAPSQIGYINSDKEVQLCSFLHFPLFL